MSDPLRHIDVTFAKAMAHPVRLRALHILNERVASPSDIARELNLPVANVSYHGNTLFRLGCIEQVEHRYVRGAIEHLYRAVRPAWAGIEDVEAMPRNVRQSLAGEIFEATIKDAHKALVEGTVDKRSDLHWSITRGDLDDEAFRRIHDILDEAMLEITAEQESARKRIADGATSIPWRLSILHYQAAE